MKRLLISASLAAAALSTPAYAQQRTGILIVDADRVLSECVACKAANTQLVQRQDALRARATQLQQQLQTEGKALQAAVDALKGKDPDAALQQRINAFETKQKNAQQELATSQQTLEATASNVRQQIGTKVIAIVEQIRAARSGAIVLAKASTMANDSSLDITTDVLNTLNQQLPSVSVTAPATRTNQPQGR